MTIISAAMVEALVLLADGRDSLRVSNTTDALRGSIYHLTAERLDKAGLVTLTYVGEHFANHARITADGRTVLAVLAVARRLGATP